MESTGQSREKSILKTIQGLKATRNLSTLSMRVIADISIQKKIAYGKNLWSIGDSAEFVGLLISGAVEINRLSPSGKESCLGIFGPSNAVGISAVLKRGQYPATARSVARDTEVLKLFLRPVLQDKKHPAFEEISTWLRELLLSHEHVLRDKIDLLSASRVEDRVAELLRQLINRFGIRNGRHGYSIPFAISKTQMARLIEMRVETVIRLLSRWSKEGLVAFEKNSIRISDFEQIQRVLDSV